MKNIINDSFFYHIYPIGFCGAPQQNDFCSPAAFRLDKIYDWVPHLKSLGVNSLYLGPVFESTSHGYDTVDYYHIDRRLGNNQSFKDLCRFLKDNGIRIVLDAVFNHTGRDFWAFKDVNYNRENSRYKDWFYGLKFSGQSHYNDPFTYSGWNGHYSLVKLNLRNHEVREHLFNAIKMWINEFEIDGLRLDAADCLDFEFMKELSSFCKSIKPDFWLMGEVIHGDYNKWVNQDTLDSVTNYECYKGLYSSHVDVNYFEIAYSLNRMFGDKGIYKNHTLYNFADNHDVNRVASSITDKNHLFPLHILLFTMPGIPSVYYGSEWGIEGKKENNSDHPLRPCIELHDFNNSNFALQLKNAISRFSAIRNSLKSVKFGTYKQLLVKHSQFAFMREYEGEKTIIAVNSSSSSESVIIPAPDLSSGLFIDVLNKKEEFQVKNGNIYLGELHPNWGRILKYVG